jgi:hypothetical protein
MKLSDFINNYQPRQRAKREFGVLQALPVNGRLHVKTLPLPLLADLPRQRDFSALARAKQGGGWRTQQRS